MIPLLVAQPTTHKTEVKRSPPKRIVRERAPRLTRTLDNSQSNDEKHLDKLLAWFFILLILPAIVTLVFLALNPDAFMIDITPTGDF